VTGVGRVTVKPSLIRPLPGSVAAALKRQATVLEGRLQQLDAELGLAYPPVDVLPVFLRVPGEARVVHARVILKSFADINRFRVEMLAPSLISLADNEDLLDGILAHEFLHYVWLTVAAMQAALGPLDSRALKHDDNYPENYEALDHARQVPPEGWLTPRLQRLMMRAEDETSDECHSLDQSIIDDWVLCDLPSSPLSPDFEFRDKLVVDEGIFKRARELGLVTSGGAIPHR
jgi:hypothetical protein